MKALRLSRETVFLFGILVLAFFLRIFAVNFGLPHLYHADEPIVVNHALAYGTGDLNPHFFKIPPLVSYLLFFCYGFYYLIGRGLGLFHSSLDFERLFYLDPTSFYLIARIVFGVILGTAAVYGVFRLVKRFWNAEKALWAALFLAVNFLHARDSHYIYADIPLLCVLLAGFYVIFRVSEVPLSWKEHLLCGGMIGLATATKYNGFFLIIPYLWICVRSVPWRRWPLFWVSAGMTALLVFVMLNPYSVLDASFYIRDVAEQSRSNTGGMPWFHPLKYSLVGAMGAIFLTLALLGWLRAVLSGKPRLEAVAVFVLGYYFVIGKWGQPYDRYVLPLVPFLCILGVDFLIFWKEKMCQGKRVLNIVFLTLIYCVMILPAVFQIVRWDQVMAAEDVRTVAKSWIETHIPSRSRIAMDGSFFMPRLSFTPGQLQGKLSSLDRSGGHSDAKKRRLGALISISSSTALSYELYFLSRYPASDVFSFAEPQIPFDLAVLRQKRMDYVLVVEGPQGPMDAFIADLTKTADPVMRFSPYRDPYEKRVYDVRPLTGGPFLWKDIFARDRNGYPIIIYRLKRD